MAKITVTVITKNEAANIAAALESVRWADELVVVDAESTDDTVAIARGFTERVIVRPWTGYIEQKNFAAGLASNDWILSIDADERVTPDLASEVGSTLVAPACAAYRLPRVTYHLGRWIRTTDWYPDRQLRLYNRHRARWSGRYVHEALAVNGTIGDLLNDLQHFPFRNIADHLDTINRYTGYAARQMYEDGRRARLVDLVAQAPLAFLRNYIVKRGATDGAAGAVISAMNAYYVFLKFAKLWELQSSFTADAKGTKDTQAETVKNAESVGDSRP